MICLLESFQKFIYLVLSHFSFEVFYKSFRKVFIVFFQDVVDVVEVDFFFVIFLDIFFD